MDLRLTALKQWLDELAPPCNNALAFGDEYTLVPVAGDASFRRYFRLTTYSASVDSCSFIIMDAPPEKENCVPFVAIAKQMRNYRIPVPGVLVEDLQRGFLLLEDFGDRLLLPAALTYRDSSSEQLLALYQQALDQLLEIQQIPIAVPARAGDYALPDYDKALLYREMHLFDEWFVEQYLGYALNASEKQLISRTFRQLADNALQQAKVFVHRDYHSRNLLLLDHQRDSCRTNIGVIDFQDAVAGPWSYDLASVLKDCYIELPDALHNKLFAYYCKQARLSGFKLPSEENARRAYDLMAAQRHLKVSGIFARLALRDGKLSYLKDIPLTLKYLQVELAVYPDFSVFLHWFEEKILPLARKKLHMQATETETE